MNSFELFKSELEATAAQGAVNLIAAMIEHLINKIENDAIKAQIVASLKAFVETKLPQPKDSEVAQQDQSPPPTQAS